MSTRWAAIWPSATLVTLSPPQPRDEIIPWEARGSLGLGRAFARTFVLSIAEPHRFYFANGDDGTFRAFAAATNSPASQLAGLDDADNVRPGIPANVRLIHFKDKFQPVVQGKVISVSADRLVDTRTGVAYYQAEIEVDRGAVAAVLGDEKLQPGLPAEVMIGLGSHTALEYLFAPLNRRLQRAMREE